MPELILAHVWNGMVQKHGAMHPTCRPCFEATAKRWDNDKTYFRLDEVTAPEAEPHPDYIPNECFYCERKGEMSDNESYRTFEG